MPSGEGQKRRTNSGGTKTEFRAASAKTTRRDEEAPQPEKRKRRDGTKDGQIVQFRRAVPTSAARERYGPLRKNHQLVELLEAAAAMMKDMRQQLENTLGFNAGAFAYLTDTLDWMNPFWPPEETNTFMEIDEGFSAAQAWHNPKL